MQSTQSLFTRDDTLFGVCEGIGEDFGFHPSLLRIGFAVLLFASPAAAIGGYAAAGALVLVSRLLVPNPAPAIAHGAEETGGKREADGIEAAKEEVPLAEAA